MRLARGRDEALIAILPMLFSSHFFQRHALIPSVHEVKVRLVISEPNEISSLAPGTRMVRMK